MGQIGQPEYYAFNAYSETKVREKLDYMRNNPVKAGLVSKAVDRPHSPARRYFLKKPVGVGIRGATWSLLPAAPATKNRCRCHPWAISGLGFSITHFATAGMDLTDAAIVHAAVGSATGAINAAMSGGNAGFGALTGGVSGGKSRYVGGLLPDGFGDQLGGRMLTGAVAGGITAKIVGGDFTKGMFNGAWTAGFAYLFNDSLKVIMYAGHNWFGHLGMQLNSDDSFGLYPHHNSLRSLLGAPGQLKFDGDEGSEKYVVTLNVTPDQAIDMLNFVAGYRGDWAVQSFNCANFIPATLNAGGINIPQAYVQRPYDVIWLLQNHYYNGE